MPLKGKRRMIGKVVSHKMAKTAVVAVEKSKEIPLYRKSICRTEKYHAHDEKNLCREGDIVEIVETRPLSKTKRWLVYRVIQSSEGK